MKQHIRIDKLTPNQGILDFSHLLDAPAGKHGFVQAKKGHFYFENGERIRFMGFAISTRSNTPDHATAEKLAERFASMGVNVIRLHAADAIIRDEPCSWSSCRETPLLDYDKGSSRIFNPEGLDRFDYLFAMLKEKGIYLHIDLLVARQFVDGDDLEHPGTLPDCLKRYPTYNARMMELQKEYARQLLCHVNPYTGLAIKDDPAVMTVQITNEESAIKGAMDADSDPAVAPYRQEVADRFGDFLLMKYHTREKLARAWTLEDQCALGEEEDPAKGTVKVIKGGFYQPANEPMGDWNAEEGPARYADFIEFGTGQNRRFYLEMIDYLRSLGVKQPIACSNLVAGSADVYGHMDGDVMENDCYFNHPLFPLMGDTYLVPGPMEYVSANPLTMQRGAGVMGNTLTSMGAIAAVEGKPLVIAEWNEYGLHPFHSTAFMQMVAYASLNDWDGLILYNYHTSEKLDDQPADEIPNVFDAYNDPALIGQWGTLATMFLKGLISPARHSAHVVFTQNDWKTLPNFGHMPLCFLPYITATRNVFLDCGNHYQGHADVAVNAGYLNGADLRDADHGVYYAWSPYRDAFRRNLDTTRLAEAARGTREIQPGVHLGDQALVFDSIAETAHAGDYREFAEILNGAMKSWGIWEEGTGYVDGKLISDTGELCFDPDHARFRVSSPACGYFSGAPEVSISLNDKVQVLSKNDRITLALLPKEEGHYLLTAMGQTGTDQASYTPGPEVMPGFSFTMVRLDGKLYAETLEGTILVKSNKARLLTLDPIGQVLKEIPGVSAEGCVRFELSGEVPAINYELIME